MELRSRLAQVVGALASWLEPRRSGKGTAPDPVLDVVGPAIEAQLPSATWTPLGGRLRSRSMKVLRAEAVYAMAALQQAHAVTAAVLRERVVQASSESAPEPVLRQLAQWGDEWAGDVGQLAHALGVVAGVPVPDATIADHLEASPAEVALIEELIERGEAQAHRSLMAEQLGEAG